MKILKLFTIINIYLCSNYVFANDKFVAIVEFGYSQEYLDSIKNEIVEIDNMPEWCGDYVSHDQMNFRDLDQVKRHGDKVIQSFLDARTNENIKILPISVPNSLSPGARLEASFAHVFYCLKELSLIGLKGVNFSNAAYERKKEDLDSYDNFLTGRIDEFIKESMKFLEEASVQVTVALGNDIDRLESLVSVPHTSLCTNDWKNVYCVTSVEDRESEYESVYNWADRFSYPVFKAPDGTIENPYFVDLRYASSSNVLAVPKSYEISNYTSFLAPYVLSRSFGGFNTEDVKAFVLQVEGSGLEVVELPMISN